MLFWPNRINLIHIVYYSWNLKYFCTIRKNWNDLLNSLSYLCTLFLSCFSSGIKGSKCISKRLNKLTWSCRKWSLYYIFSYWYYIMSDFDTNLKRVIQQVRKNDLVSATSKIVLNAFSIQFIDNVSIITCTLFLSRCLFQIMTLLYIILL